MAPQLADKKVSDSPRHSSLHLDVDEVFSGVRNHDVMDRLENLSNDEVSQVLEHVLRQERGERSEDSDHRVLKEC